MPDIQHRGGLQATFALPLKHSWPFGRVLRVPGVAGFVSMPHLSASSFVGLDQFPYRCSIACQLIKVLLGRPIQ